MRHSCLFILHIPPPVHGSSVVGKYINESEVINLAFNARFVNLSTSSKIQEIGKRSLKKITIYFNILISVFREISNEKFDIIYIAPTVKGIGFWKDILVLFLSKFSSAKIVLHLHNKGVKETNNKILVSVFYRYFFRRCKVILLSPKLFSDVSEYVKSENTFYCPNGIPGISANRQFLKWSKPRILFLSNLIESKGVFVLLHACKILTYRNCDFECAFVGGVGDVSIEQFQSKLVDMDLLKYVSYLGKKYDNEKDLEYQSADIFVLPTFYHNECFPLVILEAMQHGLPVVSTFEGGIPDIVEDGVTGFLVKQRNAQELADKLELLIKNPELRISMGEKAEEKFTKEYTLEIFEKRMVEILTDVANSKS